MTTDDALTAAADLAYVQALKERAEKAEAEYEAMRRTAGALADERSGIATDLFQAQQQITALRSWHDVAARSFERLGALIIDLRTGAEQGSQSHADVLAKIENFRGNADFGTALLTELEATRALIAQLRTEYDPACTCDVCRAVAAYDKARNQANEQL